MNTIFKALVFANLIALNLIVYFAYRGFSGKIAFIQSEVILRLEERLKEEYEFIQKDLKGLQSSLLESQKKLIPGKTTVKSGLPISF